jgi:hypothetical protein
MTTDVTTIEHERLAELETAIEHGLQTFIEVGNALMEIRDSRLYREQFGTFEDYCRDRWGMERRHAYRLIDAADVVNNVSNWTHLPPPTNEAQARPLAGLTPQLQREVWPVVVDTAPNGKITGAHVQSTVNQMYGNDTRPLFNDTQLDEALEDETKPICPECGQVYDGEHCPDCKPKENGMTVHYSSESNEWYTPQYIIDLVLKALDKIDIDPCSNPQKSTPAKIHYTQTDNGLLFPWNGRIYMNPPYGREIDVWVEYLCSQWEIGNITEAIALTPARTDTQWFKRLRNFPKCFVSGRLKFSGYDNSAPFPSMITYLGRNMDKFSQTFETIGDIYTRYGQL